MTNKSSRNTTIENELRKAFRKAGYGSVDVKIQKLGVSAGYGVDTSAEFWITITKSRLTRKNTARGADKSYKIVRRKPRQ